MYVLFAGDSVIACAPIVISELIEAFQYPEFSIQIEQSSPHENSTLVQSDSFKQAKYTILKSAWMSNGLCPMTDEPYNPLGTTPLGINVTFRYSDK